MTKAYALGASTLCVATALMAGCASIPKGQTVRYALPKATTQITVTQTLGCPSDPKQAKTIFSAVSITPVTTYTADTDKGLINLSLDDFTTHPSDPDIDINLTNDGRLKSINTTMTGEGTAVVKAAISVASLIAAGAAGGGLSAPTQLSPPAICAEIADVSRAAKNADSSAKAPANLITLTYTATLKYDLDTSGNLSPKFEGTEQPNAENAQSCAGYNPNSIKSNTIVPQSPATFVTTTGAGLYIPPDPNTDAIFKGHDGLRQAAGYFCVAMDGGIEKPTSAEITGKYSNDDYIPLTLARIANVTLAVKGPSQKIGSIDELWKGTVSVPISSKPYQILVPNGSTFGAQKFVLQLADDGSITELHYTASGGASDTGSALQSIYQALPTNESKANDLSEKSDLIYQQQRLMTCKLTPAKCASK